MVKVAAVVVDYGSGYIIKRCVDALLENGVVKVVVVDNGSCDGLIPSEKWLQATQESQVEVLKSRINLGYGAGINQGAEKLECDYLVVSNADVVVDKGAIKVMLENFKDESVGIVGPKIVGDNGWYPSARTFPSVIDASGHAVLGKIKPDNRFSKRYQGYSLLGLNSPQEVDWISGAIMLIRKSLFDKLDGFDPSYYLFLEDVDFCYRAKQAGFKVVYDPRASVYHVQGLSRNLVPYKSIRAHHLSALRFEWKTAKGLRKAAFPLAVVLLGIRASVELTSEFLRRKLSPPEVDKIA